MQSTARRVRLLSLVTTAAVSLATQASAESVEWIGAGVNDNWTNANNWWLLNRPDSGDSVFLWGNPARKSPFVNEQYSLNNLWFDVDEFGDSSSFTLNGSRELLIAGGIYNETSKSQTVNVHVQFTANGKVSNNRANGGYGYLRLNTIDTNGKTVTIQPSASGIDVTGRVYNTGRIVVDGPGTVTFSGTNDWSGSLEIQRGTFSYESGPNTGALGNWIDFNASSGHTPTLRRTGDGTSTNPINFVAGEGRIAIPTGRTVNFTSGALGAGDFAKTEGGTLIWSGATATHTGKTFVREGTLRVGDNTLLSDNLLDISAGATVQYGDNRDDRVGSLSGGGTLNLGIGTRFILGGDGQTQANFNGGGVFSGTITGSNINLDKRGSGTLELTGSSTFSGNVNIYGGTVLANNGGAATSATGTAYVAVGAGAVFGGDGRIQGTLDLAPGATLSPSNVATGTLLGTLSTGTLLHRPGSTIQIEISAGGGNDSIDVSGDAFVDGDLVLSTIFNVPINNSTRRTLIHASGTVMDTFRNITGMLMSNGRALAVTYGPQDVYVTPATLGDATLDGNVNFDDLLLLAQHYGDTSSIKSWATGDFNGNGLSNFDDLLALAQNYAAAGLSLTEEHRLEGPFATDWAMARAMVPEPILSGVLVAGVLLRRSRR